MATREETLKKNNGELEKLSDDELEKIAGGIQSPWWWPKDNPFGNANTATQQPVNGAQFYSRDGAVDY